MRTKRQTAILTMSLLVSILVSTTSYGQERRDARNTFLADPTQTSIVENDQSAVTLEADENGSTLIGRVGFTRENFILNLELSSPVEGGAREVDLATLDGLTGGTTGTLSLTWEMLHAIQPGQQTAICTDLNNEVAAEERLDVAGGKCSYLNIKRLVAAHPELARYQLEFLRALPFQLWYVTGAASRSRSDFEFVDATTFEDQAASKDSTSYIGAVSLLRKGIFYSLGYSSQQVFKGAAQTELCQPLDEQDALICREVAIGGPTERERKIARLDVKGYLNPNLGVNLRILNDLKNNIWNPHLLFYFLQHDKKGLNGGIDLSYSSDDDDWQARVFVGSSFNILP